MKFLRDATPFTQLLFSMIVILMGGIFISLIGFLGCWIYFGTSVDAISGMLANINDSSNIPLLKFFQILQTLGMFILPPLLLAKFLHDRPLQFLNLDSWPSWLAIGIVSLIIVAGSPVIEWISIVNQHLVLPSWMSSIEEWMRNSENQANEITQAFLSTKSFGGLLGNIIIVAVLPAIGEELLFRGLIQKLIKNMTGNSHWAIWITAALFSALHLQFFGFLPRMLLGALFGYLLEWTGSLWLPIIAHFINNAAGVVIYFITGAGLEADKADAPIFGDNTFIYALVCSVALWFLLRYVHANRISTKPYNI